MKRFLRIFLVPLIFIIFLYFPGGADAQKVYIDIDSPTMYKFPIAIADFQNLGGGSKENYSTLFSSELPGS